MSKISTRKGLALGTVAALGFSALTGIAPAQAADLVTLVPSAGTAYNVPADETFTLKTFFATAAQSAPTDKLKVRVVDSSLKLDLTATTGSGIGVNGGAVGATTDFETATRNATTGVIVADVDTTAGVASADNIVLIPTAVTAKFAVTVQTWVDSNGDSVVDAGEAQSAVRTVNFLTKSDITATVTLDDDAIDFGQTALAAKVTFAPELNLDLFANATTKVLTLGALDVKFGGVVATTLKLDSANTIAAAYTHAGLAAGAYKVAAVLGSDELGSSSKTVVDHAVNLGKSSAALVASADAKADGTVRVGSTSHSLKIALAKADGTSVGAGVKARLNIQSVANGSVLTAGTPNADTITVGGKAVGATADVALIVTTDANGVVTVPVVATGAQAGTKVIIDVTAETIAVAADYAITWTAASYSYTELTTVDAKVSGNAAGAATGEGLAVAEGSTTTINVAFVDQFGVAPSNGSYRVKAVATGRTASTTYFPVTSGRAAVTITDAKVTGQTEIAVVLTTEKYDSAASTWGNSAAGSTVYLKPQALTAPTVAINAQGTASADYAATSATTALVAADTRVGGVATLSATASDKAVVSGTTTLVDSLVSISGASNLVFEIDGVSSAASLSGYSSHTGTFKFNVYSNKTGTFTVTVTSNGVSKTADLVFTNAETSGTVVSLDATPSQIGSGKTLTLSAKITDKFGNAVDTTAGFVALTYVGPGLPIGTLPTQTDENGVATYNYLLGAADSGTATFKVVYVGADGTVDTAGELTPDDITVTKTITIGAAPVVATAAASGSTGKIYASATNAEGKKVVVKVSGKFVTSFTGTAAKKSVAIAALKGNRTVTIYVGGTLVLTKLVTIK
ncbi:beta strand repeat-containing protein [Rhodoluna limnophila]|uniref:beta strand repeat-containing protein n=1 Tax=Rhodoluna limnophila TaxID=232537 RepID=UPI001105F0E4|nr:hypothetical protein [Rhodoluna limnophila]